MQITAIEATPTDYGTEGAEVCSVPWYAIRVQSNREFMVQAYLRAKDIATFLPSTRHETRWSDRQRVTTRPLFPGYVFAQHDAESNPIPILMIPGVVNILGSNLHPTPIAHEEIENLQRLLAACARVKPCEFAPGQPIVIDRGPLAGVQGVVTRVKGELRLVVAIELLKRGVSVEIDTADALAV